MKTVGEMIKENALRQPDKVVFEQLSGERVTNLQFHQRTNQLANALKKLGLTKGDKIGIIGKHCLSWLELYGAAAKLVSLSSSLFCQRWSTDFPFLQYSGPGCCGFVFVVS